MPESAGKLVYFVKARLMHKLNANQLLLTFSACPLSFAAITLPTQRANKLIESYRQSKRQIAQWAKCKRSKRESEYFAKYFVWIRDHCILSRDRRHKTSLITLLKSTFAHERNYKTHCQLDCLFERQISAAQAHIWCPLTDVNVAPVGCVGTAELSPSTSAIYRFVAFTQANQATQPTHSLIVCRLIYAPSKKARKEESERERRKKRQRHPCCCNQCENIKIFVRKMRRKWAYVVLSVYLNFETEQGDCTEITHLSH